MTHKQKIKRARKMLSGWEKTKIGKRITGGIS